MFGELNDFCSYVVVDAGKIKVYDYTYDREMEANDFLTGYHWKRDEKGDAISTSAKKIFRKKGIPEDYQKLIIEINELFYRYLDVDWGLKGKEVLTGIPCNLRGKCFNHKYKMDGLKGTVQPRNRDFVIFGYDNSKLDFDTEIDEKSYSWVLNFFKELQDGGYLDAYREAISEIYGFKNGYFLDYEPDIEEKRIKTILQDYDLIRDRLRYYYGDEMFLYNLFIEEQEDNAQKDMGEEEKKKILSSYGVNLPEPLLERAVIENQDRKSIRYRVGKIVITMDLNDKASNKYEGCSGSVTIYNKATNFLEKHYYDLGLVKNIDTAGENLLEAGKDDRNIILSRLIKGAKTQYGDYSLVTEEGFANYSGEPYVQIALYRGDAIKENESVINPDDCVFSYVYNMKENSEHWNLVNSQIRLSNYGVPYGEKLEAKNVVWTGSYGSYDVEIENGSEFNAIFRGLDEILAIDKSGANMVVTVGSKVSPDKWIEREYTISADSMGPITTNDLQKVLDALENFGIGLDTREFIIQSINDYITFHTDDYTKDNGSHIVSTNYSIIGQKSLKHWNYRNMQQLLENVNSGVIVEKILDQLKDTFGMDIIVLQALTMVKKDNK